MHIESDTIETESRKEIRPRAERHMADQTKDLNEENEEEYDDGIYTLTDENGKEEDFELLGSCELDGVTYYGFVPVVGESDEYVLLKAVEEDGEITLVSIEDDEEFDRAADFFEDTYFNEVDYDAEDGEGE